MQPQSGQLRTVDVRELLGRLRLPAMAAPMSAVSTPALVADACLAGIIGAFPTSNPRSAEQLEEWFDEIDDRIAAGERSGHDIGPVCANLIVGRQNRRLDTDIESVTRHGIRIVVTSIGSPAPVVDPLHAAGCAVLADVASVRHAHKALEAGADGLVLLAAGAGGHTGWANPFAFVHAVRRFYDGPLAVAGGMSDGASLWAARCAGYDLGLFGTRFIATPASAAPESWKAAMYEASMDDISLMTASNGVVASTLPDDLGSAGHTVGAVGRELTVSEVVDELETSWLAAQARTADLLGATR